MLVNEVMTRGVECVGPDDTIQTAAKIMRDRNIGPVPVCENQRLTGVLTDRDIAVRAVAAGNDPTTCRVRDVMTPGVTFCFENQSVDEAELLMEEHQIRRLIVLDREQKLVGMLSLGDLAVRSNDFEQAGRVLCDVSIPSFPVGA